MWADSERPQWTLEDRYEILTQSDNDLRFSIPTGVLYQTTTWITINPFKFTRMHNTRHRAHERIDWKWRAYWWVVNVGLYFKYSNRYLYWKGEWQLAVGCSGGHPTSKCNEIGRCEPRSSLFIGEYQGWTANPSPLRLKWCKWRYVCTCVKQIVEFVMFGRSNLELFSTVAESCITTTNQLTTSTSLQAWGQPCTCADPYTKWALHHITS